MRSHRLLFTSRFLVFDAIIPGSPPSPPNGTHDANWCQTLQPSLSNSEALPNETKTRRTVELICACPLIRAPVRRECRSPNNSAVSDNTEKMPLFPTAVYIHTAVLVGYRNRYTDHHSPHTHRDYYASVQSSLPVTDLILHQQERCHCRQSPCTSR